ncbi:NlpC/P60 family protein [Bacillus sp. FJAT-45037]|uniref:NlpC/P60 family protein n=1 Tax=Bacillus sp. FJAT-45037 TaxID=2011007 RepID=UPI001E2EBAF3|nr:NlpC/P60 family protein [Bacillus sp. FJAT-45037]
MKKWKTWILAFGIATAGLVTTEILVNPTAQANTLQDQIIRDAHSHIGTPYVFGGRSTRGFDCSGFLSYVFEQNGVSIPRTTAQIYAAGEPVSRNNLQKGDLVFFTTYQPGASHAGIYLGNNQFIHASSSRGITVSSLNESYWSQRYIGNRSLLDQTTRNSVKVDGLVAEASITARSLRPYYVVSSTNQLQITPQFEREYNAAKYAVETAQGAGPTGSLISQVNDASNFVVRAASFFDGVRMGERALSSQDALAKHIQSGRITDEMVAVYNENSRNILRGERAIGQVTGSDQRRLFGEKFIVPAKITRETVIWEMTRYKVLKDMKIQVENNELSKVEANFALLSRLENRSSQIKASGNALYPGAYNDLPEIEAQLEEMKREIRSLYEAKK